MSSNSEPESGSPAQAVLTETEPAAAEPAPQRARRIRAVKLDQACADAVEQAREAALFIATYDMSVGEYQGCVAEGDRVVTHSFACDHPGYRGWRWSVTVARASRARKVTIDEVVLLPGEGALQAPSWVPWAERIQAGDVAPGILMPTPDSDPRLEPGFTGGEQAADLEPAEASQMRAVVAELGLGRERVLSGEGRDLAAERWLAGEGGPDNEMTRQAPGTCQTCGYFVRLQGNLGTLFGACSNEYSPSDARVVNIQHGCGGHSDVVAKEKSGDLPLPVWDTISVDESLFD